MLYTIRMGVLGFTEQRRDSTNYRMINAVSYATFMWPFCCR